MSERLYLGQESKGHDHLHQAQPNQEEKLPEVPAPSLHTQQRWKRQGDQRHRSDDVHRRVRDTEPIVVDARRVFDRIPIVADWTTLKGRNHCSAEVVAADNADGHEIASLSNLDAECDRAAKDSQVDYADRHLHTASADFEEDLIDPKDLFR